MKPLHIALTLLVCVICSCNNGTEEDYDILSSDKVAVTFCVSPYQQVTFDNPVSTRATNVSALCKYLVLAVYRDGNLDTVVNGKVGDDDFAILPVHIHHGNYRVLMLGHSSDKLPDIDNPSMIDFGTNNLTDVLYWSDNISLNKDTVVNIRLHRAVAKVEIQSTDNLPSDAYQLYIRYTGGSYSLNAITGKASRPYDDYRIIKLSDDDLGKPLSAAFYTFPTENARLKELQFQVSKKDGTIIDYKIVKDVPIKSNAITRLTGSLGSE